MRTILSFLLYGYISTHWKSTYYRVEQEVVEESQVEVEQEESFETNGIQNLMLLQIFLYNVILTMYFN